jgi:hypothetical protein
LKILNCVKNFEHIHIIYEGGEVTMQYREYKQTLKLFKKVSAYGEDKVVVSSSGWFEYEHTVKRYESEYFCMLSNGKFILIARPDKDNDFGDECVIVRITNKDV